MIVDRIDIDFRTEPWSNFFAVPASRCSLTYVKIVLDWAHLKPIKSAASLWLHRTEYVDQLKPSTKS